MSVPRASISHLPSETLIRILALAVGDSPCAIWDQDRYQTLLSIPLVCVRWNHIATGIRSLWSHVDLHISLTSEDDDPNFGLGRIRLWLDRSRGLPIHIHFPEDDRAAREDLIQGLVSVLRPHATFLRSMILHSSRYANSRLTESLLSLFFTDGILSHLQTLVLSQLYEFRSIRTIPWPRKPLPGLVELDLYEVRYYACPTLDEIVAILSNCPVLHTLKLRKLSMRIGRQGNHPPIRLPSLRLLEIVCLDLLVAPTFLSVLFPGVHELNIRLDLRGPFVEALAVEARTLLMRSNPISLAISEIIPGRGIEFRSYLACAPNLRTLLIDLGRDEGPHILGQLLFGIDHDLAQILPHLQALCIAGGRIDQGSMEQLQRVVSITNLRYLVFSDCWFPPPHGGRPHSSERHEESEMNEDEGEEEQPQADKWGHVCKMPESVKGWVPNKVGNVMFYKSAPGQTCRDLDLFVEGLLKLDQDV
ncbi:hypothetical protein FRC10_007420 [Ceratobasidium sp. 414]|nr:hypothetical protein FRC10_007420 [Ceratobasidium sp. 414]